MVELFRHEPTQSPAQMTHTSSYTRHTSLHVVVILDLMSPDDEEGVGPQQE